MSTCTSSSNSPIPSDFSDPDDFRSIEIDDKETAAPISSSAYAKKARTLMELDKALHALGAQMFMDIPNITVIGSQSAGKSSLVEAVSGISLPRSAGTCTRCPMECRMSSDAKSWSCTITLLYLFDHDQKPLAASKEVTFGTEITDRSQVEIMLRRAQAAILSSPSQTQDFLEKNEEDLNKFEEELRNNNSNSLSFSLNIIRIDVKDPELTDLSFVDLPGLISNHKDDKLIELIRGLVVSKIKGENTVIVIAIPMSDDMENQPAVKLAKEIDPEGERTIGVLTKPDTIPPGARGKRAMWREIIEGNSSTNNTKHGFYCVRLPDDDEREGNFSRDELRRNESKFFETNGPWNQMLTNQGRFGVPNFVKDISRLLIRLIEKNIPKLKAKVDKLVQDTVNELAKLPLPPVNDPSMEILLRVNNFHDAFKTAVNGERDKTLVQSCRRRYEDFKTEVLQAAPDFRPVENHEEHKRMYFRDPDHNGILIGNAPPLDLNDVREIIADSIGWELPGDVPFEARRNLITKHTQLWKAPAKLCFHDVSNLVSNFLEELMVTHFGQFKGLLNYIRNSTRRQFEACSSNAEKALEKILEHEIFPIYTLNTSFLQAQEKYWLDVYTEARAKPWHFFKEDRDDNDNDDDDDDDDMSESPMPEKAMRSGPRPRDIFHDEILVMSKVRAYFQVAYKRIIDNVPLSIEHDLKRALSAELQWSLLVDLTQVSSDPSKMQILLQEDPAVRENRNALHVRRARLNEIRKRLADFYVAA